MTYSLCFAVALWLTPVQALANDTLAQAIDAAHEGDFDRALAGFSRALKDAELARPELVRLLVERSYVWFALRDKSALELDLRTLAWLEPSYQLDLRAPPELQRAWQDAVAQAPKLAPSEDDLGERTAAVALAAAVQAAPTSDPELRVQAAEPSALPQVAPKARLLERSESSARDDRAAKRKWWWIGASGAAVVATGVVLALTLRSDDPAQTELDGPKVTF